MTIALANRFLRARKRGSCKANTTSSVSQQTHLYKPGAHAVSKPLLLHQQATISAISPQSPHNGRRTDSCSRQRPGYLSFLFTRVSSSSIDAAAASHQHPGHQSRRLCHVPHSGIVPACHVPPTLPSKRLCTKHHFQAANQRCKPTRFCRQAYMTRAHRRVSSEILHIKNIKTQSSTLQCTPSLAANQTEIPLTVRECAHVCVRVRVGCRIATATFTLSRTHAGEKYEGEMIPAHGGVLWRRCRARLTHTRTT